MTQPAFDADGAVEAHAAAKARIPDEIMRSVAHATFHLERTYDVSPTRVWTALTDRSDEVSEAWAGRNLRRAGRHRPKSKLQRPLAGRPASHASIPSGGSRPTRTFDPAHRNGRN
jgi:hypothetical protein